MSFERVNATTLRVWSTVLTGFADGNASNALLSLGPAELTIPHVAGDSGLHVALRGFGDAGADLWERLVVRARDRCEAAVWQDVSALAAGSPRHIRARISSP